MPPKTKNPAVTNHSGVFSKSNKETSAPFFAGRATTYSLRQPLQARFWNEGALTARHAQQRLGAVSTLVRDKAGRSVCPEQTVGITSHHRDDVAGKVVEKITSRNVVLDQPSIVPSRDHRNPVANIKAQNVPISSVRKRERCCCPAANHQGVPTWVPYIGPIALRAKLHGDRSNCTVVVYQRIIGKERFSRMVISQARHLVLDLVGKRCACCKKRRNDHQRDGGWR